MHERAKSIIRGEEEPSHRPQHTVLRGWQSGAHETEVSDHTGRLVQVETYQRPNKHDSTHTLKTVTKVRHGQGHGGCSKRAGHCGAGLIATVPQLGPQVVQPQIELSSYAHSRASGIHIHKHAHTHTHTHTTTSPDAHTLRQSSMRRRKVPQPTS
jgi:hypothetical protein